MQIWRKELFLALGQLRLWIHVYDVLPEIRIPWTKQPVRGIRMSLKGCKMYCFSIFMCISKDNTTSSVSYIVLFFPWFISQSFLFTTRKPQLSLCATNILCVQVDLGICWGSFLEPHPGYTSCGYWNLNLNAKMC